MLSLFVAVSLSKKSITELSVKYTAACPLVSESMIILDLGKEAIKAARYGSTFVRLSRGHHVLEVSHPWCTFYNTEIDVSDDGSVSALINGSLTTSQPFPIRHVPNKTDDPLAMIFQNPSMLILIVPIGLIYLFRKCMSSPKMMAKIQEQQALLQQKQKEVEEENRKQKKAK